MKGYWLLSLLLCCSCTAQNSWQAQYIQADENQYASSKITYPALDKINGLDIEMLMTQGKLYTYIQVHSQTLPSDPRNPKQLKLRLLTPEGQLEGIAYRHEGGQRALLSDELQSALIEALRKEQSVTLQAAGFSAEISSENFPEHFQNLEKPPLKNPFHLPFKF